jgi:hypothetical protein
VIGVILQNISRNLAKYQTIARLVFMRCKVMGLKVCAPVFTVILGFCLTGILALTTSCVRETVQFDSFIPSSFVGLTAGSIPKRQRGSLTGSQFLANTKNMLQPAREKVILAELRRGNVPDFLRRLRPVKFSMKRGGKSYDAVLLVMPDYLALGSDSDFVRIPMTPVTAQNIADHYGLMLPTKKMVDVIYERAEKTLPPKPLPPKTPEMELNDYYLRHNAIIEGQLEGVNRSHIIAGHKKDIILTNQLVSNPFRVAIYGWHRSVGNPIQPVSLVHGNGYADYSHGVRLVAPMMIINNKIYPVAEVLQDSNRSYLISEEGPLRYTRLFTVFMDERVL